jgi:hypothetical protein
MAINAIVTWQCTLAFRMVSLEFEVHLERGTVFQELCLGVDCVSEFVDIGPDKNGLRKGEFGKDGSWGDVKCAQN